MGPWEAGIQYSLLVQNKLLVHCKKNCVLHKYSVFKIDYKAINQQIVICCPGSLLWWLGFDGKKSDGPPCFVRARRLICVFGVSPMFPRPYIPRVLCSPVLYSPVPMFPRPKFPSTYIPRVLCSPELRLSCVPRVLCSPVPMFPQKQFHLSYIPRSLCSPGPMLPGSYVPRMLCSASTLYTYIEYFMDDIDISDMNEWQQCMAG